MLNAASMAHVGQLQYIVPCFAHCGLFHLASSWCCSSLNIALVYVAIDIAVWLVVVAFPCDLNVFTNYWSIVTAFVQLLVQTLS